MAAQQCSAYAEGTAPLPQLPSLHSCQRLICAVPWCASAVAAGLHMRSHPPAGAQRSRAAGRAWGKHARGQRRGNGNGGQPVASVPARARTARGESSAQGACLAGRRPREILSGWGQWGPEKHLGLCFRMAELFSATQCVPGRGEGRAAHMDCNGIAGRERGGRGARRALPGCVRARWCRT